MSSRRWRYCCSTHCTVVSVFASLALLVRRRVRCCTAALHSELCSCVSLLQFRWTISFARLPAILFERLRVFITVRERVFTRCALLPCLELVSLYSSAIPGARLFVLATSMRAWIRLSLGGLSWSQLELQLCVSTQDTLFGLRDGRHGHGARPKRTQIAQFNQTDYIL